MNKKTYMTIEETLFHQQLDNGLDVYIIPKRGYLKTYSVFTTKFGAKTTVCQLNEENKMDIPYGTAHFLEHKLFEDNQGEDITHLFNAVGADVNAFTSYDQTTYIVTSTNKFYYVISLLLDFVQTVHVTEDNVRKEQGIITQECKLYLDNPSSRSHIGIMQNMYRVHPIRENILGTKQSLSKVSKEILEACHQVYYHPSNMMLVIAGDVDVDATFALIRHNQNKKVFNKPMPQETLAFVEPPHVKIKTKTIHMDLTIPRAVIGCKLTLKEANNRLMLEILCNMMLEETFGYASVAYQELLDKKLINAGFSYYAEVGKDFGHIIITANTYQVDAFITYIKEKLLGLSQFEFEENSLNAMKKALIGAYIKSLNVLEYIAHGFVDEHIREDDFFNQSQVISQITAKDFEPLRTWFNEKSITNFRILPKK